jgi:hypothetical protein
MAEALKPSPQPFQPTAFERRLAHWMGKGLAAYQAVRRPFLSRITLLAVAGGILIASGSWWIEPAAGAVAPLIDPSNKPVHDFLKLVQSKKQAVDTVAIVCGTVIICVSLVYHFFAFYAERMDARHVLSIELGECARGG